MSCSQSFTPISGRLKELRESDPTPHQNELFSNFMKSGTSPTDQQKFDNAWEILKEIDRAETQLSNAIYAAHRSRLKKKIRRLDFQITPAAKRAAAKRNRPLIQLILQYVRLYGAPQNIANLIKWLTDHGFPIVSDRGRGLAMTERRVRQLATDTFGIEGKRGRKPKMP